MPTSPTPVTAQVRIQLRRLREEAGLTQRGASAAAGISANSWRYWETLGAAPRLDCLERALDMLRVSMSEFMDLCEQAAGTIVRSLEVREVQVRPPRDWTDAVAQAAASLCVDGFDGGLLRYGGRWVVLVPTGRGQVRIDLVRGGERLLAQLAQVIDAAAGR